MKILLIACPRSGSTSLLKALSKTLNLSPITVPDTYKFPENSKLISSILNKNNVIVRTSINYDYGISIEKFTSKFDYVILLSRKNNKEHKISFSNLYYKRLFKSEGWHDTYSESEISNLLIESEDCNFEFSKILSEKENIEKLSKNIKVPVIYYEDLFSMEKEINLLPALSPILDISKFKLNLSQTKRMRIKSTQSLI